MSHIYKAVQWNPQKKIYDKVLALSIIAFLLLFIGLGSLITPNATIETLLIRASATGAFLLLQGVLIIGPLARINPKWLPILYNRRHMGVCTFLLSLIHAILVLVQYHSLGVVNPIINLFTSYTSFNSISQFPFEILGAAGLIILFCMAATSHDFWLKNLSAPVWKILHIFVYLAYALLCAHVLLGFLQTNTSPVLTGLMFFGFSSVFSLHILAGLKERKLDIKINTDKKKWVYVAKVSDIPENKAKIITVANERVAVFKYDNKLSAVSNVCQHQNGPLGEGRIINGCITCPWHGFQYHPSDGCAPKPFTEKVPTFNLKLENDAIYVYIIPNPAGTEISPIEIGASHDK